MKLTDIILRTNVAGPWEEGENIPWHDPEFSRRMLGEHLSQEHDAASRRTEKIEKHVDWIHNALLSARPARVLDLGCGPGLYISRLAKLGHQCVGIDYSPASIAYAVDTSRAGDLDCKCLCEDIRTAEYGRGFDLAMLIHGEFNVFRPSDAEAILRKAHSALVEDGLLLVEAHTAAAIRDQGGKGRTWYSAGSGLFSDSPYLCLEEAQWDEESGTTTLRYYIVEAGTGHVTRYAQTFQAYTQAEYRELLTGCGFPDIEIHGSLSGEDGEPEEGFTALVARKSLRTEGGNMPRESRGGTARA